MRQEVEEIQSGSDAARSHEKPTAPISKCVLVIKQAEQVFSTTSFEGFAGPAYGFQSKMTI